MSEELLTDATTEPEMEVESNVEKLDNEPKVNVDDMSDSEFAQMMDGEQLDTATEDVIDDADDNTQGEDIEALYDAQNASGGKLDKPLIIQFGGKTHKLDDINELKNLIERGLGSTKKYQDMSEQRKILSRLEQNGYSQDDLLALAEEHKGSKLAEVNESISNVEYVAREILNSDYSDKFQDVIKDFPADVISKFSGDAGALEAMAYDVKTGLAQKLMPQVNRMITVNGMSFDEAYIKAATEYEGKRKSVTNKREALRAQPTNSNNSAPATKDVWEMTDKEFSKFFGD